MAGVNDWSQEGFKEVEEPGLQRRTRSVQTPSSAPDHDPSRISGSGSPSSPPGLGSSRSSGDRPVPQSVRTGRCPRAPSVHAAAGGAGSSGAGGSAGGFDEDEKEKWEVTVESELSFPSPEVLSKVGDAVEVVGQFAAQFMQATMDATVGPRMEEIRNELLHNRRMVDVVGLERWLRKMEALAELAWFTDLCSREQTEVPPLELFECAFRALEGASSDELHRAGADARRFWIGPVAVLAFFLCPVSKKVMDNPVVITSGKTVDCSELEKWWKKEKRICPVTGEVLKHDISIPDVLIARCISRWHAANKISDLTTSTDPPAISPEQEAVFKKATVLAYSPISSKEDYEAILCLLEQCSFLHLFGRSPGTITNLACVLPETCLELYPELDNIILGIFAKAASYSPNKEVLGDDRYAIPVLIARAFLGPLPTRAKCAEILGLLADNYYNKIKIGELGGFAPLMELLLVGDIGVKKTVAVVLASLCEAQENWSRFLREGVADAAISLLRSDNLVEEAHSIFLQAEGFDMAITEIMDKLGSFQGDKMCQDMFDRLWDKFIQSTPGQRRRPANFAPEARPEASSSSSSSSSSDDVQAIVSWLQNRSYNPRTYRYSRKQQARMEVGESSGT